MSLSLVTPPVGYSSNYMESLLMPPALQTYHWCLFRVMLPRSLLCHAYIQGKSEPMSAILHFFP